MGFCLAGRPVSISGCCHSSIIGCMASRSWRRKKIDRKPNPVSHRRQIATLGLDLIPGGGVRAGIGLLRPSGVGTDPQSGAQTNRTESCQEIL